MDKVKKGRPKGTKIEMHIWSDEEKTYLREITKGRHHIEILEAMNSKFDYQFSLSQIKAAIKRYGLNTGFTGRFEKGVIPYNLGTKGLTGARKTSFKKGHIPNNHREVGSERVNIYGYVEIKVAEPKTWRLKHQVVWESVNGPIPKGCVVIFADKNKFNFDIDNLLLITKRQLLTLNQNKLIKDDKELTKTGVIIADLIIKVNDITNNV